MLQQKHEIEGKATGKFMYLTLNQLYLRCLGERNQDEETGDVMRQIYKSSVTFMWSSALFDPPHFVCLSCLHLLLSPMTIKLLFPLQGFTIHHC